MENGQHTECSTKSSMENTCIMENKRCFSQTEDTPMLQTYILDKVGLYAEKEEADQILNGTFSTLPECKPYLQEMIKEMRMENIIKAAGPIPTMILLTEHQNGWQKQKEKTTLAHPGLSFSDHKAASFDDKMSKIEHLLHEIPYNQGFSPELYQVITNYEILKKAGVYDVENMRTIQLFIAQFNMNNKKSGRDLMVRAESLGAIPKEQAGSFKHHQSICSALNKVLTIDLLWLRRQADALCCDRIVHWVAALCMR
jgi:hypothetical protein